MAIIFTSTDIEYRISQSQKVKNWLKSVVVEEGFTVGEISIVWCSDNYLLEINKKYLNHDYFTDIITFDYSDKKTVSGDLMISLDTVRKNAEQFGVVFHVEQLRVLVHGVLHLCGYKDKSDEEQKLMTQKEDYYLSKYEV